MLAEVAGPDQRVAKKIRPGQCKKKNQPESPGVVNLGACAGFALVNCDWLGKTIAFSQVFFQQGRVASGK